MTKRLSLARVVEPGAPGSISLAIIIGTQNSGAYATSVPTKPSGATPMMVKGWVLSRIVWPTMAGSAAKRFCQQA